MGTTQLKNSNDNNPLFDDIANAIEKIVHHEEVSHIPVAIDTDSVEMKEGKSPEIWALEKILEGNSGKKKDQRSLLELLVLESLDPILQRWVTENMQDIVDQYINDNSQVFLQR